MTRKDARENCFKLLFEYEVQKITAEEALSLFYELTEEVDGQSDYIDNTVKIAISNIKEIDGVIEKYSKGWKVSRLAKVTLAVLRVAVCEILYMDDIADGIAINEAVEIAKKYNDEKSSKFVNGVLSSVHKSKEQSDE
ncbi:MAG: transcription antitermination factor NusB [Clostridia bacterium]|nr:transcription antitermination factor NusB [Clostridia bacterium]